MGKFGKERIESLEQAAEHAKRNKVRDMRFTKVELPDVKSSWLSRQKKRNTMPTRG